MKLLLYCTKQPHKLYATDKGYVITDFELGDYYKNKEKLNGKIVAECDFEVEEIKHYIHYEPEVDVGVCVLPEFECSAYCTETLDHFKLLEKSCLKDYSLPNITVANELDDYLKGKNGYAIHINNLNIFNKSRELYEYLGSIKRDSVFYPLQDSTQNMMYAYQRKDKQLIKFKNWQNFDWALLDKTEIEDVNKYILIPVKSDELQRILNDKQKIIIRKKVLKEMI